MVTRSPCSTVLSVLIGGLRKGQGLKKELKSLSSRSKKKLGCSVISFVLYELVFTPFYLFSPFFELFAIRKIVRHFFMLDVKERRSTWDSTKLFEDSKAINVHLYVLFDAILGFRLRTSFEVDYDVISFRRSLNPINEPFDNTTA